MERELLFPVGEHQWSRTTSPRFLASLLKTSIEGYKKVSFLTTLARVNPDKQKLMHASQEEEVRRRELAPWADGVTCLPQRIPLSLHTKRPLSESKLTKQEGFRFVLELLGSGLVFALIALPHVSLAFTLLYLQGQLSSGLSRVTGHLNIPSVSFNSKSTLLSLTSYII